MRHQTNSHEHNCPVLFVEDNHRFREMVTRRYLSGCRVTELSAGKRFLEILRKNDYHFILMDYELPDTTGEELTRLARDAGYCGAIIGVSSSEYLNQQMLRAGADTAISKREHFQLPRTIRQGLSLASAQGCELDCSYGELP